MFNMCMAHSVYNLTIYIIGQSTALWIDSSSAKLYTAIRHKCLSKGTLFEVIKKLPGNYMWKRPFTVQYNRCMFL